MKLIRLFIATFVVVMFSVFNSCGQLAIEPQPSVQSLSIGSEYAWVVFNATNVYNNKMVVPMWRTTTIFFRYIDSHGIPQQPNGQLTNVNFNSFTEYTNTLVEKTLEYARLVAVDPNFTNPPIQLVISMNYSTVANWPASSKSYTGLLYVTNLTSIAEVTAELIQSLKPIFGHIVLPIADLDSVKLEVSSNSYSGYTNTWTPASGWKDPQVWPYAWPDLTTTNLLVLNPSWCEGLYWERLTIVSHRQSYVFTQHGGMIRPAVLDIKWPLRIDVHLPCGSDLVVQKSPDQIHWTEMTTRPWSLGTNFVSIFPKQIYEHEFYRAKVR